MSVMSLMSPDDDDHDPKLTELTQDDHVQSVNDIYYPNWNVKLTMLFCT